MINRSCLVLATILVAYWSPALRAAPIVDGSLIGDSYGVPLAVQSVQTGFGDNDGFNPGNELDAAYGRVESGKLYVFLSGNLQDNFNKLVLFFDSNPGGQNIVDTDTANGGTNPVVDPSPFPPDPGMFAKMGLAPFPAVFDPGFTADYALILRQGFTGTVNRFDADYAVLGGGASQYLGLFDPTISNNGITGTGANSAPIGVGFNNSNVLGVVGGTDAADQAAAAAVQTGIEIAIPLADLGNPTSVIKVTAFITNSNHDYASNQFLGGLTAPQANLGSDGFGNFEANKESFDLSILSGNQYFQIAVPEPSTSLLASLTLLALLGGRDQRESSIRSLF